VAEKGEPASGSDSKWAFRRPTTTQNRRRPMSVLQQAMPWHLGSEADEGRLQRNNRGTRPIRAPDTQKSPPEAGALRALAERHALKGSDCQSLW